MANPYLLTKKLISAVNFKYNCHIVINTSNFFNSKDSPTNQVHVYSIREDYYFADGDKLNKELFKSASSLYTCLYMRDLLYALEGREIPEEDNEGWNKMRAKRDVKGSIAYIKEKYGLRRD